ncbi:SAVMC3_10250 family protein [Kitasatospora cineracea]|uniref:SAVMC3_10250 family protein n=1 Tax=Kitasatospora cineracea TaxID=88074 RepID=UPI003422563C
MREVIYLSEGKLHEFLPEPRRAFPVVKVHAGVSLAGVNVEKPASDSGQELRRQLKRVEKEMGRHAPWYTETDPVPGRWVRFKASLSWFTLRGRHQDLVLFVDQAMEPSRAHRAGGARRLLLHGSARHLLGRPPLQVEGPALTGVDGGISLNTTFLTSAGEVVNTLARTRGVSEPGTATDGEEQIEPTEPRHRAGIRDLLAALDTESSEVSTAAMVTGYARVSALLPGTDTGVGCLVASPLIVEYVK